MLRNNPAFPYTGSDWLDRLRPWFGWQWSPFLFCLVGMLLTLPSVWSGYFQDDHLIRERFQGFKDLPGIEGNLLDTCVFGNGRPEHVHAAMDRGLLPWWTSPNWKIAFFRPLSSLSSWMDWQLFGDRAWAMHLHSVFWYGLLVWLLALLYRRLIAPPWVAGLAGLLYALDAAHGYPVAWIATRNAALSSVFIVLTIYFHDRWRRDNWKPGFVAACAALAVGLLGSEATAAAGAYLAAYALFVDPKRWFRGGMSLLPYLAIVIIWRLVYDHLGYGVAGTMLYTDPIREWAWFLPDLASFLPIMLFSQLGGSDPSAWSFLPSPWIWIWLAVAVLFLIWVGIALWPLLRRDKTARFWALGMVLSTIPVCTTIPQGRELMNPGIGAMALVALFLGTFRSRGGPEIGWQGHDRLASVLATLWVFLHLWLSAVTLPIQSATVTRYSERFERGLNDKLPADPDVTQATLFIVRSPADLLSAVMPFQRAADGTPVPRHTRLLYAGMSSIEIERPEERTLVFRCGDSFLKRPWTQVFRDPAEHPFRVGDTVRLTDFEAEVTQITPDGQPREVRFRFAEPLEAPSYRWVIFEKREYVPFTPPPIGQTVRIRGFEFRDIVKGILGR